MDLKNYSDKELLAKTKNLIREEQKLLSIILSHLEEIERRKLYSDLGYQSLFDYALKELCYTEQQAWRRINAMRVMRKLPELRNQLNDGSLSLSNINMASSLFKDAKINSKEKQLEIFAEIKNTTKQACEEKIFELKREYGVLKTPGKTIIKKTSQHSSRVHVNLSSETLLKLEKIKNLTKEQDLDKIISLMADSYIKQKIEVKCEHKKTPIKNSRYIPRKVKEIVYKRANGECENCQSTHRLEYEHIVPFAMGGTNDVSNISLFCSNCNKRKAIKDFGLKKMDRYLNPQHTSGTEILRKSNQYRQ
ncbi:MAG: hypothetical protein A2381_14350 [Bdellovibrionales bacterium RIFOXYB1_FULL_37_110]|nr:MAG: hypothetical protein A2417_07120 [Bdellovibrionales bacterium RIFOXYC1_FULL_37_79]OFZ57492.1 MAG: hypothetical protein A2328_11130 [Bdellovibrionales bacterium RIFOXYB2_FULL_36_6]OFZ57523.1 MAG: hypothetical protein A2381_14350 [Bdellovibrionales bacterium RIFOXYB1_FULL_37_110]OFZ62994.1 MAG: hypothetical protein A2577_07630 [Bdellovibrionales bacterium RIFOXYD1_FULL_36_51]